ncbi:MAG: hypothetical protein S0880_00505 [Actinomycetota bacterium]|nr:hypothetical protein [Actinomycetota bacterium]
MRLLARLLLIALVGPGLLAAVDLDDLQQGADDWLAESAALAAEAEAGFGSTSAPTTAPDDAPVDETTPDTSTVDGPGSPDGLDPDVAAVAAPTTDELLDELWTQVRVVVGAMASALTAPDSPLADPAG